MFIPELTVGGGVILERIKRYIHHAATLLELAEL